MPTNNTGLSLDQLTVRVMLLLARAPGQYTARGLARELGETATRVHRIVQAIEEEQALVRDPGGALRLRLPEEAGP